MADAFDCFGLVAPAVDVLGPGFHKANVQGGVRDAFLKAKPPTPHITPSALVTTSPLPAASITLCTNRSFSTTFGASVKG